ncbi:uncharacterized protein LOC135207681, partial [Macrobrachium nipponense]|uniref:uncharacterized protein LOC135207681 n=1 Tax=Macrobrachium nipponense TaxID=159736 RepID=UPI0030C85530
FTTIIYIPVTLLGCCLAAGQSSPRQFEIASLPAHEEGYYLNRQFQNSPRSSDGTSEQENVRQVVDSQGRYWVVAEPATPEPGFYLNRHFQKDKAPKPKKNLDNRVFLVKKNPETSDKTIVEVEPKTARVADAVPSIHKVFPGLAATRKAPVQAALTTEAKAPVVVSPTVARPESPSSTAGQRVANAQDTVVSSVAGENKPNPVTRISQPPQVSPSQTKTEQGGRFSCDGKEFGYYSDVESNCQQYHVCNPVNFGNGHVKYYKYSFSCSDAMRWDPIKRVCASLSTASPCQ